MSELDRVTQDQFLLCVNARNLNAPPESMRVSALRQHWWNRAAFTHFLIQSELFSLYPVPEKGW
jgi:hypothetical protein